MSTVVKIMRKVAIIGGGAAGLFCSIYLKELLKDQVQVVLLEKQSRVGKKILVTGNGKCNLSNYSMDVSRYNTPRVAYAIRSFTPQVCVDTFYRWGLLTRQDQEGRVYPFSEKATSVVDLFVKKIEELGIQVILFEVSHIKKCDHFLVYSKTYQLENVDYVVLATGGMAGVMSTNGYQLAKDLAHTCTPLSPTLVAIKTSESLRHLSGIRMKTALRVVRPSGEIWCESGEILFKDEGLSGILALDASRYLEDGDILSLDLASDLPSNTLETFLENDETGERLQGMLPKMLAQDIRRRMKSDPHHDLLWHLHHFILHPIGTYGHQYAQLTKGGIPMEEVNPYTFESLKTDHLYVVGEILDVDGACGGYNLHFAWASAYQAACDIAKKIKGE